MSPIPLSHLIPIHAIFLHFLITFQFDSGFVFFPRFHFSLVNMKWVCFFMLFMFCTCAMSLDSTALLSLVRHWKSVPPSIKLTWNSSDSTPCSWAGVHCNRRSSVVGLNLSSLGISGQLGPEVAHVNSLRSIDASNNDFSGSIPQEIGNCSFLEYLDLSGNSFFGEIPESVGDLRRLKYLSLFFNSLTGPIPKALFQSPFLNTVYLSNNMLSGSIPDNVGNTSELEFLYLGSNRLSGTIPSSIGNCSSLNDLYLNDNLLEGSLPFSLNFLDVLVYLDVSDNNLKDRIPLGMGSCKEMQVLVLSNNAFSGGVPPVLGNCSSLTSLAAVNCGLTGPVPSSLGQLTELTLLYLSANQLSGAIPPELSKCKVLNDLQLYGNSLEGMIPSELGMLNELHTLMLFTNHLSGRIPISVWKIQSLQNLIVYQNNLTGEIPEEITGLKQLRNVSLFDNQFTGALPQGLGINSNLTLLDLTRNNFTGPIPPNLCITKHLRKLLLGQNHFQGNIPSDIGSCITLARLILKQNKLTGILPEFVENPNILFMDLSNNSLSGSIPSSLGNLKNITSIDLSFNKFTGRMPSQLGSLVHLEALNLSYNAFEGLLPSSLSGCYKLSSLDVRHNQLNGMIPLSLRSLTELSNLDLSENRFTGGVPKFLFQLKKLSYLHLGANLLSGTISPNIGLGDDAQSLRSLNLSYNGMTGHVPMELGKLTLLEQLDLCCNNLSGSLDALGELHSLFEVNISHNFFTGPVPPTMLKFIIATPTSFAGNPNLCFSCHPKRDFNCVGNSPVPIKSCQLRSSRRGGLRKVDIAMVVSVSFILALILVSGISCVCLRHKAKEQNLPVSAKEGGFSLLNQIMEATENLKDTYIIGRGANGTVYKVTLGPDKAYAVKKLGFLGFKGKNTSIVREIETIGKVKHRNLVRLEAFWLRQDYGLILYSFMKNGSLHDVLHETSPPPLLEWNLRYKIALGTAHGLSYLHFDCDPAIIHRDIKPMNILLDADMEPHISDFGIAKLLDQSVASTTSSVIQGTIGYMAPEIAFSTNSSKESDVYAYGVVLLELITRKKVLDPSFGGEIDIVEWVRSMWNTTEDIEKIVDSDLLDEFLDSNIQQQVKLVLLLGSRCTEKEASRRPCMREVVKQLLLANSNSNSNSNSNGRSKNQL